MLCPDCRLHEMERKGVYYHKIRSRVLWNCACGSIKITSPVTFEDVEWEQARRIAATKKRHKEWSDGRDQTHPHRSRD